MNIDFYSVYYNDIVLAQHMTLENALLFIKALFHEHYNETDIAYSIKKEQPGESGLASEVAYA